MEVAVRMGMSWKGGTALPPSSAAHPKRAPSLLEDGAGSPVWGNGVPEGSSCAELGAEHMAWEFFVLLCDQRQEEGFLYIKYMYFCLASLSQQEGRAEPRLGLNTLPRRRGDPCGPPTSSQPHCKGLERGC